MKNKNWLLKFCIMVFAVLGFSLSFSSAINFHLNIEGFTSLSENALAENMMYVHFADNGNDFGGFIYFSDILGVELGEESEEGLVKAGEGAGLECSKKMEGFYYNAERGERLWPLDISTARKFGIGSDVTTNGGIYTVCMAAGYKKALEDCVVKAESEDGDNTQVYTECENEVKEKYPSEKLGYYGMLTHEYSGQVFNLVVGVDYDTPSKGFVSIKSNPSLSPTFIRVDNKYPVGFIYDNNGGVGLAGCRFLTGASIKNLIIKVNDVVGGLSSIFSRDGNNLKYNGDEYDRKWISCNAMSAEDDLAKILVEGIVGLDSSGKGTKFGLLGNSSDTKMQYFGTKAASNSKLINYVTRKAEFLCRGKWSKEPSNGNDILCLNDEYKTYNAVEGRTMVVKHGDVKVKPDKLEGNGILYGDSNNYYDIFILNGNLVIDETDAQKYVFTTGGFLANTGVENFNKAVKDAMTGGNTYIGELAGVGSFIRGNFVVNGKVTDTTDDTNDTLENKYFIYGKFITRDTIDQLEDVFSWRCDNGIGSDGNFCPKFEGNPYRGAALVVIDQNYSSPLFDS